MTEPGEISVVVFEIFVQSSEPTKEAAMRPTRSDSTVRDAWAVVSERHAVNASDVLRIYSEWEPSAMDKTFVEEIFPDTPLTWTFARPEASGWKDAITEASRDIGNRQMAGG